jgi:multiple sugar transport system substrate-binding protein
MAMRYTQTLTTLLLAALMPGCGDEPAAPGIILRVANWGSPAVVSDFLRLERELKAEFEAAHPGVRVQIEQIPGEGQFAPKVLMMHVTGSAPDVIQLDASAAAVFIDNGVVADLAPRMRADPEFRLEDYFPTVIDVFRRNEAAYAVPLDFTPMVIYYNKRIFDEAGVPYPREGWTWADFLSVAKRLTIHPPGARAPTRYGVNFENWMAYWLLWLWTNGGDVLSPDGRRASGFLDGPQSTSAVQFIADLIDQQRVAPSPAERAAAGVDLFRAGRAAMDLKGHWMWLDYRADGLDIGVVGLPTNGVAPVTVVYASGLAVMSKAAHPDLAWEYVKFMTTRGVQVRRVASGLAISGNRAAAAEYAGNPVEDAFLRQVQYARPPWGARVERYPYIEDLGREMMENILVGGQPVPEALRRTAAMIDSALAD